jgi:hypothetical protein
MAALWWLSSLLAGHLQGLLLLLTGSSAASSAAYDLAVLPGVVLHELAHLLVAVMLGVRVVHADLFRFRRPGDPRQGEVIVERVDPVRMSLVGAGPLLAGLPVVLLLLHWLHVPPLGLTPGVLQALRPLLREPWSLLRLYLLWAIANAMFPSAADRAAWWIVGIAGLLVAAVGALTGYWPALPSRAADLLLSGAARLTTGLLPVVVLDLLLLALVIGLEWLMGRITGRRLIKTR